MAFDVCGPLPAGTTVLEASAGTGKTFTLAALAARYVAEGIVDLPQLLMITFGRAATQELRERVRERFVSAERGLRDPAAARRAGDDEVLAHLATADDAEVDRRRHRLAAALAGFDGATIATTHGFCQQVLTGLGILGDTDTATLFVENTADLVTEVADDLYLAMFARAGAAPPLVTVDTARRVVREAVGNAQAVLAPADAPRDTEAGQRFALATRARSEVEGRKRRRRLLDYDDLIGLLGEALRRRSEACELVRDRYRVVLVDEFQDTDEAQWQVLRRAFHEHVTLVLVGDPKQAIYAFRGGDVHTYLAAADAATGHEDLGRNWRSDPPLLAALDRLYGGAALGDPRIVVRPVEAGHPDSRLTGAAPLRLRLLRRARGLTGMPAVGGVRQQVSRDLAADVVRLLDGPTRLSGQPVRPRDVAVLVRTNVQGALVRTALQAAGVPVVLAGGLSVFATPGARAWTVLLQAIEAPNSALRARAAALTPFLGWSAAQLDARGDEALDELGTLLRQWAAVYAERGVAALFEVVSVGTQLVPRLLAEVGGERALTDLRHLTQELHRASGTEAAGLTALLEWLQRRRAENGIEGARERSRRLESDAEAVEVRTVHVSKGLEWPVVYVPFGWDRWEPTTPDPLLLHDGTGQRVLDVGGKQGPGWNARLARHRAEDAGEELRLLYVALTRAQSQVVTWWAPSTNTRSSGLHRLLFGDRDGAGSPPLSVPVPADDAAVARLERFRAAEFAVETATPAAALWTPPVAPPVPLSAASFDRSLDTGWRRTSYSGLTSTVAHPPGVASEPEEPELADEPPVADLPAVSAAAGTTSPMADLPAGTAFGTLVHEVLERVDTAAADLRAELVDRCTEAVGGRGSWVPPDALAEALVTVLGTPVPGGERARRGDRSVAGLPDFRLPDFRLPDFRLCDVAPRDRLVELTFELPLAGGDAAADGPTIAEVAELVRGHLPADDPLAGYPDLLAALPAQALRGYLTGSIDALLRVGGSHLVVDYKTNNLGDSLADYAPSHLARAMLAAHYPLQALLYCVAAHRFLRWRLPAYDIDTHLGGVRYLFVRGMAGPASESTGVFAWRPPSALVTGLSGLLA